MKNISVIFLLLISCISVNKTYAQAFNAEKLWSLNRLSNSSVSPNEKWIVYQSTSYDYKQNRGTTSTVLLDRKTNKSETLALPNVWNLAWTPSSDLVFLQSINNETLLQKYSPIAKTTITLFNFGNLAVSEVMLSNDGKTLVSLEQFKIKETTADKYPDLPLASGRIEDDLFYRHWDSWTDPSVPYLFWYEADASGKFSKKGAVMQGENFASVPLPFGGIESVSISNDGKTIYYSTKKKAGKASATSTNSEVYAFNTVSKITTTLTSAHKGYDANPQINPAGTTLAWLSMERDGFEADKNRLRIMNLSTRVEQDLSRDLDLSISAFQWHPTKQIIYFTAVKEACTQLFSVDLKSGKITQETHDQCDYVHFSVLENQVILERQDMIHPVDLWELDAKTKKCSQLTNINKEQLSGIAEPSVVKKWITTTDGKKMLTWVILPPNFDENKKYPTLLYCQGGPQSAVSQFFSYRWNFRLMASNGYIVVAPNRRGLPGFGQEWNDAISKDWGGQAMRDYLVAIDSCVAEIPAIDKDKLGAVGASYGGYSVYYLAGIHQNRFKAFISHCGLFNLESWYGTTEELFFANWDIGGPYWLPENKEYYAKNSPHNLVANWNTPMLVIHGGKDFRVPETEGMQAFQVLQLKGIPSKFLYFPDEGHWVRKPQNSILWQREFFSWLDTYLK
jgi:dipeptidyl aminopeptidase/acylaminoacyl peptidase